MSYHIDKIIYINLNHRTDRRIEIEGELDSYGLQYERFEAISTPGCGSIGCSYSHLAVLKIAKEHGYRNILIVEDDFTFKVTKNEFEESLEKLFSIKGDFDVCMLGYNLQRGTVVEAFPFLTRVEEAQTTSAYIVNASMYDKLIELYEWSSPLMEQTLQHWNYACDQSWKRLQPHHEWYCFTRRIGIQRPSFSDCGGGFADHNC
jgi:glycosyl transferase family 25